MPAIQRAYLPGEVPTREVTVKVTPEEEKAIKAILKKSRLSWEFFCSVAVSLAVKRFEGVYTGRVQGSLFEGLGPVPAFRDVGGCVEDLPKQGKPRSGVLIDPLNLTGGR